MQKLNILVIGVSLTGLVLSLVGVFVYLTQAAGFQFVVFQSLYWTADRTWSIERTILFLAVTLTSNTIVIVYRRELSSELNFRHLGWIFLILAYGLLLGLIFHNASVCCDSPVIFNFGFPFNWLEGVTNSWHYLSTPNTYYLIHNLNSLKWFVVPWNLLINIVFWFNVGLLFFSIRKIKWVKFYQ